MNCLVVLAHPLENSLCDHLLDETIKHLKSKGYNVTIKNLYRERFDRVWAPGYAYNHASDFGPITPCLERLKELKVITTLGSPWWIDYFILWMPVKRILKLALLGACTKGCKFQMLSLYKSEYLTQAKVDKFIQKIKDKF